MGTLIWLVWTVYMIWLVNYVVQASRAIRRRNKSIKLLEESIAILDAAPSNFEGVRHALDSTAPLDRQAKALGKEADEIMQIAYKPWKAFR